MEKILTIYSKCNNPRRKRGVYKDFRNQYPTYCNSLPPPPRPNAI